MEEVVGFMVSCLCCIEVLLCLEIEVMNLNSWIKRGLYT